jgi:1A family penicillin-binding protein
MDMNQKKSGKFFDTMKQQGKKTYQDASPHVKKGVKKTRSLLKRVLLWIGHHSKLIIWLGAIATMIVVGIFFIWVATLKIPTLDNFSERKIGSSTKIYDRTGEVILYDVHENIKRTVVAGETIDQDIKNSVIAIEDKDFYTHKGIKLSSTVRGVLSQLLPGNIVPESGGSTITQQVIKNTLLTSEKRISRKVKEWILALKLEQTMSKDEILALYLNEAPYGGAIYGVEQAAKTFFGKSSSDVTIAESAYLAAIPNAPTYYSPYGKNKERLEGRKNTILQRLLDQGYINKEQYTEARAEVVEFKPLSESSGKALHFVDYIRAYLEEKYGKDELLVDGLKVTTTLDWKLQEQAEKSVNENALKNETDWKASNQALIAIDPKNGQILSMVGSRGYLDPDIDGQFNVTTARRQPGSSFKPIIYARAFEKGYRPETILFDVPTQFNPSCAPLSRESSNGCYAPDNYDGKYAGPINLRNALGQSRNIPAVKLLYLVGVADALQTAKQLGITTLDKNFDRYGLTLVLGGGEVTLLELTSVYGVLANDGIRVPPTGILKIEDLKGNVLEEYKEKPGDQVISAEAARMVSSVLSDNVARTPLFGANSQLNFGDRPVAAKTGTTNDNRDAWIVGYSPDLVVGVWSGNNDNSPMKKGSSISVPTWRTVMNAGLQGKPIQPFGSFSAPDEKLPPIIRGLWWGGESFFTDILSGKLATEFTPPETKKEYVQINPHSILYWINKSDLTQSRTGFGIADGQYKNWEATVQQWILTNGVPLIARSPEKPTGFDDVHTQDKNPVVVITQPQSGQTLSLNSLLSIQAYATSERIIQSYEFYINGQFVGSQNGTLADYQFTPSDYISIPGKIDLEVRAVDTVFSRGSQKIPITFTE